MSFGKIRDDHFRLAVESAPSAMIVTDSTGVIQYANEETGRMFGYRSDELIGKSVDVLVPNRLREGHALLGQGFFANPSKRSMGVGRDLRATHRSGREFPVEIALTPIATDAGPSVLATVVDITTRREAESALASRARELERANERLGQFAYVASHDLQEPLRKIAAFSNILEEAIAASDQGEMVHANSVIRNSAKRARELVDDLLTYSHTVNDAQQLQNLDLKDEIEAALNDLSQMISEAAAEMRVDVPHMKFRADRLQFARLIHNVVSNAIKYKKPDLVPVVQIIATKHDRAVRLAIIDNGIGFEPQYATMIFEPFKRLHSRAVYPGTGIGLAICKSIADRHGWRLSIESEPGRGASFFVDIQPLPYGDSAAKSDSGGGCRLPVAKPG
jgi:PAS domain S-box-containing protein